jgi:ribosome assembly protein YihI (activator of Der GTPase)
MSARIHEAMRSTISKAKSKYPQEFNLLTEDEQLVIEALEAEHTTVLDVQMYTRFEKARVLELLQSLIAAGHVREHTSEPRSYTLIHK